jgi:pyridoxal-5'-phosphate-dependent protein, beta subunit
MIINNIQEVIGNTPLFLIPEKIHGIKGLELYAKCEFLNPFGSVKDRTAMGLLREAQNHEYIIESSSGNTAKALGILASIQGKKLLDVSRKMHQQEVEDIIKIVGTEIKSLPAGSECPDPNDPNSPLEVIKRIMSENPGKYYYTDQFSNTGNPKIHEETTAKEIDDDIGTPDFFFAGLGTTGSSKGIRDYFVSRGNMKSIGIITAGHSHLPGIRNSQEMFEVGLFDPKLYADFSEVDEQNAIDHMLVLIRKCGLLVGPTSGATFY